METFHYWKGSLSWKKVLQIIKMLFINILKKKKWKKKKWFFKSKVLWKPNYLSYGTHINFIAQYSNCISTIVSFVSIFIPAKVYLR